MKAFKLISNQTSPPELEFREQQQNYSPETLTQEVPQGYVPPLAIQIWTNKGDLFAN
jgi:hypothetical protein